MPKAKQTDAPQRVEKAPEPSLAGVGPDDPTYQKPAFGDPADRPDTPEARRDAVLRDIENQRKARGEK